MKIITDLSAVTTASGGEDKEQKQKQLSTMQAMINSPQNRSFSATAPPQIRPDANNNPKIKYWVNQLVEVDVITGQAVILKTMRFEAKDSVVKQLTKPKKQPKKKAQAIKTTVVTPEEVY